jgi:FtsP/CotA-like multicopper oxidase with cupredoxin domain
MGGLVIGIRVKPRGAQTPEQPISQTIRLLVRSRANVYGQDAGYGFVRGDSPEATMRDSFSVPGPMLELTRGKRVAITIVNQSHEAAAVHWHGIELESFPDGVPGWSGSGGTTIPFIMPGDSLTVRFTPPRAGTFMYHSHFDEFEQINSWLYGPIVVLEPGERFDPETDRVLFVGQGGPTDNVIRGPFAPLLLNGSLRPAAMELKAGTSYRFRFLNLSDDFPTMITLGEGQRPTTWRAVAKDGADLPRSQTIDRPAVLVFDPGETYDFQFTPQKAGELSLTFGHLNIPGFPPFKATPVAVRVR